MTRDTDILLQFERLEERKNEVERREKELEKKELELKERWSKSMVDCDMSKLLYHNSV